MVQPKLNNRADSNSLETLADPAKLSRIGPASFPLREPVDGLCGPTPQREEGFREKSEFLERLRCLNS